MQKYLYQTHSREEISHWQNMLSYFCYKRAYGGHANDFDEFKAGIRFTDKDDLIAKLQQLGISLAFIPDDTFQPEAGHEYPAEWFLANYRSGIDAFPNLEQPGNITINGVPVFVWVENDHILFSVRGIDTDYEVTQKDADACLAIEELFDSLRWQKYKYIEFAQDQYYFKPGDALKTNKQKNPVLFKSLLSKPGRSFESQLVRIFIRAVAFFFLLIILALGYTAITDYPVILLLLAVVFYFLYRILLKTHTHILIDQEGIHYLNKLNNKTIRKVLWKNLRPSAAEYDITSKLQWVFTPTIPSAGTCIVWWESRNGQIFEHRETFDNGHIWYVGRNTRSLMTKFIEGAELFRPDLRIDPRVIQLYVNKHQTTDKTN